MINHILQQDYCIVYVVVLHIQETADVEFVVEDKTIYAHKILLTMRSDFFKSMFSKEAWKESSERLVRSRINATATQASDIY